MDLRSAVLLLLHAVLVLKHLEWIATGSGIHAAVRSSLSARAAALDLLDLFDAQVVAVLGGERGCWLHARQQVAFLVPAVVLLPSGPQPIEGLLCFVVDSKLTDGAGAVESLGHRSLLDMRLRLVDSAALFDHAGAVRVRGR